MKTDKINDRICLYTLENENIQLGILNIGATIRFLNIKDKNGEFRNVILGYEGDETYLDNRSFFGTVVGRNANRIKDGTFTINGKRYQMDRNENGNNLHSGYSFFCNREYMLTDSSDDSLTLTLFSNNLDQGFPGNMTFSVRYALKDDNVYITYSAVSDEDTVFNPTNHSYFNLGYEDTVYDHTLKLCSSNVVAVDKALIPTGDLIDVTGTSFDFRDTRCLGDVLSPLKDDLLQTRGIDHNFIFDSHSTDEPSVVLMCPTSGISMKVFTDLPSVQIYTANYLDGVKGNNDSIYNMHSGICVETGFVPDSINSDKFKRPLLKKDEVISYTVRFDFSR
jgi:aldose 1-epimerase